MLGKFNYQDTVFLETKKVVTLDEPKIKSAVFNEKFLYLKIDTRTVILSLNDFEEIQPSFDASWNVLHSDNRFLYLRKADPKEGNALLIWDIEQKKEAILLDSLEPRHFQRPGSHERWPNNISHIHTDDLYLYITFRNSSLFIISKNNWDLEKKIVFNEEDPKQRIFRIFSDDSHIFVSLEHENHDKYQPSSYLNILDRSSLEIVKSRRVDRRVDSFCKTEEYIYFTTYSNKVYFLDKNDWMVYSLGDFKTTDIYIHSDADYIYLNNKKNLEFRRITEHLNPIGIEKEPHRRIINLFPHLENLIIVTENQIRMLEGVNFKLAKNFKERVEKLINIQKRTEFLKLEQLVKLMEFNNTIDLLNWLYILPSELSFTIKADEIFFNEIELTGGFDLTELDNLFSSYESWRLKEKQQKLANIIQKTEILSSETLSELLKFDNPTKLLDWIFTLPSEIPILIKGSDILFQLKDSSEQDIPKLIDLLLNEYKIYERESSEKSV